MWTISIKNPADGANVALFCCKTLFWLPTAWLIKRKWSNYLVHVCINIEMVLGNHPYAALALIVVEILYYMAVFL
jgi:hypothetical protein